MIVKPIEDPETILRRAIALKKTTTFTADYIAKATDEETLGILVSCFFKWDCSAVVRCAAAALEDSNYHSLAGVLFALAEGDAKADAAVKAAAEELAR